MLRGRPRRSKFVKDLAKNMASCIFGYERKCVCMSVILTLRHVVSHWCDQI